MVDTDVFQAIADPTRRQILCMLASGEQRVTDIANHFEMSRPAVSKHLARLEAAELICVNRKGREAFNRLQPERLEAVANWLNFFSAFWDDKLRKLKQAVEEETGNNG